LRSNGVELLRTPDGFPDVPRRGLFGGSRKGFGVVRDEIFVNPVYSVACHPQFSKMVFDISDEGANLSFRIT
jgi:hypothetical protein